MTKAADTPLSMRVLRTATTVPGPEMCRAASLLEHISSQPSMVPPQESKRLPRPCRKHLAMTGAAYEAQRPGPLRTSRLPSSSESSSEP